MLDAIEELRGSRASYTVHQPGSEKCNRAAINKEGDLLFVTAGKNIWGYNLMTEVCFRCYEGHDGMVEDVSVDDPSLFLASVSSGSPYVFVHNVETGQIAARFPTEMKFMSCCAWAPGRLHKLVACSSTQTGQVATMFLLRFFPKKEGHNIDLQAKIVFPCMVQCVIWPSDNDVIGGDVEGNLWKIPTDAEELDKSGSINIKDVSNYQTVQAHRGQINNLSVSANKLVFATASSEALAATWDMNLEKIGTFTHSFVVSCAALAPDAPHIVLASSSDKANVARTNMGSTDYTINFYNVVFQDEFASMKVARSPVNWIGFTADGMTIVTTHEEGTFNIIRLGGQYATYVKEHKRELAEFKPA